MSAGWFSAAHVCSPMTGCTRPCRTLPLRADGLVPRWNTTIRTHHTHSPIAHHQHFHVHHPLSPSSPTRTQHGNDRPRRARSLPPARTSATRAGPASRWPSRAPSWHRPTHRGGGAVGAGRGAAGWVSGWRRRWCGSGARWSGRWGPGRATRRRAPACRSTSTRPSTRASQSPSTSSSWSADRGHPPSLPLPLSLSLTPILSHSPIHPLSL
jgi:hypothetical protein